MFLKVSLLPKPFGGNVAQEIFDLKMEHFAVKFMFTALSECCIDYAALKLSIFFHEQFYDDYLEYVFRRKICCKHHKKKLLLFDELF